MLDITSAGTAYAMLGSRNIWDMARRCHEFRGPNSIPVQFVFSSDVAGDDASYNVSFPDPADVDAVVLIDGLPAVTLATLMDLKLACGLGSVRRKHRDFADVVELILVHDLGGDFARLLHKSVRPAYRKLVRNAHGG